VDTRTRRQIADVMKRRRTGRRRQSLPIAIDRPASLDCRVRRRSERSEKTASRWRRWARLNRV